MHPAQIKAAIQMRGYSLVALAEALKIDRSLIGKVISGRSRSAQVEEAIAKVIARPIHEIWPQWYRADGTKRSRLTDRAEQVRRASALLRAAS